MRGQGEFDCYCLKSCQRLAHKRLQLFWLVCSCNGTALAIPGLPCLSGPLLHPMNPSDDTDQRLMALEIKASYSDDLLEQLNLLVYRQQLQIDALAQQLQQMGDRLPEAGSGGAAAPRNLRDELPPHY